MRERQRQRVRRVGRGRFGQIQHPLDHFGDGGFLRRAVADDGLFHLAWRDFKNFQTGLGNGRERRAARFTHDERGLQILRVKESFDNANGRVMFLDGIAQGLGNFYEAARAFPACRAGNRAVRQGFRKRLCQFDDAIAGAAQ